MDEIKVYLDKDQKNIILDKVEFDIVNAGETSKRFLYVFNDIEFPINVKLILSGEYISISKTIDSILPGETKQVEFEINPKLTLMKPITATLDIKINYIVK